MPALSQPSANLSYSCFADSYTSAYLGIVAALATSSNPALSFFVSLSNFEKFKFNCSMLLFKLDKVRKDLLCSANNKIKSRWLLFSL